MEMSRSSAARARLLACALLLLLPVSLHWRFLTGRALLAWDATAIYAPWSSGARPWNFLPTDHLLGAHAQQSWNREEARWNPYVALGIPSGMLVTDEEYPPARCLARLLAPHGAQVLSSIAHLAGAGLLMFGWLRWRRLPIRAALLGAIALELSPLATLWLSLPYRTSLLCWSVAACWGAEAAARSGRPGHALGAGAALGLATLSALGDQSIILLHAVIACIALGAPAARRSRALLLGCLAVGCGAALSAVRWLPFASMVEAAGGTSIPWEEYLDRTARLRPAHLLLLVLPDAFGHPVRGFDLLAPGQGPYANYQEAMLHVGIPGLVLAAAGAVERRFRLWAVLALGALCVAAVPPVTRLAWALLPGFSTSGPMRALWVWQLAIPLLAARGFAGLERARPGPAPLHLSLGVCALVALAAAAMCSPRFLERAVLPEHPADHDRARTAAHFAEHAFAPLSRGLFPPEWSPRLPGLHAAEGGDRRGLLLSPTLGPLLLAASTAACAWAAVRSRSPGKRRLARAALAGVLAGELLSAGLVYNPWADPGQVWRRTPAIEVLERTVGRDRALLDTGTCENTLQPFRIGAVGGYVGLLPSRTRALLQVAGARIGPRQLVRAGSIAPAWREALAVRGVLTGAGASPSEPAGLTLLHDGADARVWAPDRALPRARLHPPGSVWSRADGEAARLLLSRPGFDPTGEVVVVEPGPDRDAAAPLAPLPARIVAESPERVELEVDAPEGGVLVLADALAPGWTVWIEGREAPPLAADLALRGVRLPPAFHGRVEWVHAPAGRGAGLLISLCAAIGLLGWACVAARRPAR